MRDQLHVCSDAESLAQHARDWLVSLIHQHHGRNEQPFSLALSGGSTPKRLYQLLAELPAEAIDWSQVWLIWGDERNVSIDDAASNFRMVRESLLDHIPIPADNVLAVPNPGGDPGLAADEYESLLRQRLMTDEAAMPAIDCVLLGMGDDVHTASIFPGTTAVSETNRLVVANRVPQHNCWRITLTAPFINTARNVAFLLSGTAKQEALAKLWHAAYDPLKYPAQLIRPTHGQLWYLADQAAVGHVQSPESIAVHII